MEHLWQNQKQMNEQLKYYFARIAKLKRIKTQLLGMNVIK